ncbi:LysE family translocator [Tahibacter soli]|uniref:LysE family translocator n=1 Tax=Tahibacter soli TaxID=2983605 RepID=A0A9X3YL92_9GAMM|nr:LysE family translocator [Tahibacter soli]MDC8014332.1 LysE family translocator [Tahibacter soli]
MDHAMHLWLFFLVVFAVVLLPGLDMAFVLGSALVGGRRHGLIAVAGIVAGGVCHVAAAALGVGLLIKLVPGAFNAVLVAGALYMAWIGASLLHSRGGGIEAVDAKLSAGATFRRATLTTLLNPKAYLFMLAIFPQFISPEYGPVWLQCLVLGAIIWATQAGVYGSLAIGAAGVRGWMAARPGAGLALHRSVGAVLVLAAVWTGFAGWQGL